MIQFAKNIARVSGISLALASLVVSNSVAQAAAVSEKEDSGQAYDNLKWRFIGPYRGGRVLAVSGVVGDPLTYYMGAAGGGVWKTSNAGQTWNNISDKDFNVGSIGAIGVSQSDPNVVYVGTGESPIRGVTTSHGDGVYKSTDAGKSFTHIGLRETRQISALVVHPTDPDTAFVAAQGNPWGPNEERGIFKTTDGGETWSHVLKIDDRTGASDLVFDPTNPRILYAAMWNHGRTPWYIQSGDEKGGIYKSIDGGETWKEMTAGLPKVTGKIGIDVAASNPNKVYAIVEAEKGGLYVSSNGGKSWYRQNAERIIQARSWYYNHINVDPTDENTLYIMNAPLLKSVDGGKSFKPMRAPHGDHHDIWFNPTDGKNFINANDGGANVTFDGGKTWSSIHNQPTAQFYRVITDNREPFWVYGGQQDNSTLGIRSSSFDGSIGREDMMTVGGGESAHIAFDPDNPRYYYATTINATLTEFDAETERTRPIKPYPEYTFGRDVSTHKYRYNWNAPVIASPHDPSVIYYGAQVLLKSTDRGNSWTEVSPDLTKNDPDHQGKGGGPITNEQAGAENYNTIFYIAESSHEEGTIWVGSDDGLVHLTRDGGANWDNVTPRGVGEAHINAIDISPHDPATAYVAVAGYKSNDFTPSIYVTRNYGKSWKRIDKGLPGDTFVRVVREDPAVKGLLYAGTEAGAYVSFNDGKDGWRSLDLNLPPVPITDMKIRQGTLVAATQGRGFWLLDDLGLIQSIAAMGDMPETHFFDMGDIVRSAGGAGGAGQGDPTARAKRGGATLTYYVSKATAGGKPSLSIDIMDASGALVRSYKGKKSENDLCRERNSDKRRPLKISTPSLKSGLNQWTWDMRRDAFPCVDGVTIFAGLAGPRVVPGAYQAKITLGDTVLTKDFTLTADPRAAASPEAYAELDQYLGDTSGLLTDLLTRVGAARDTQGQIRTQLDLLGDAVSSALKEEADDIVKALDDWVATVTQPKHKSFDDDINWPNMLDVQIRHLVDALDRGDAPVTAGAKDRYNDLKAEWEERSAALDAMSAKITALGESLKAAGAVVVPVP